MKWQRVGGAVGFVLLLGACEVEMSPPPRPPPPRYYYYYAAAPPPPRPPQQLPPAPPPPPPAPPGARPERLAVLPPPAPAPALSDAHRASACRSTTSGPQFLDLQGLQAMVLRLRPDRKCGPREIDGGHWIHLDCNVHAPVKSAKAFTPDKLNLLLQGLLNLDNPIGKLGGALARRLRVRRPRSRRITGLPDSVDHRTRRHRGPRQGPGAGRLLHGLLAVDGDGQRHPPAEQERHDFDAAHLVALRESDRAGRGRQEPEEADHALGRRGRTTSGSPASWTRAATTTAAHTIPRSTQGSGAHDAQLQAKIRDSDSHGQWEITEYDAHPERPGHDRGVPRDGRRRVGLDGHRDHLAASGRREHRRLDGAQRRRRARHRLRRLPSRRRASASSSSTTAGARPGATTDTRTSRRPWSKAS